MGLKQIFSKLLTGAASQAGAEATRRGLQKLEAQESREEREAREARERRKKALWWLGGGAVGLVLVIALMTAVLEWLLFAGFAGARAYGSWLLLRPRLKRLGAARAEARAARKEEETKHLEASQAESAEQAKHQALEDELAALKARSDKDG